MTATLLQLARKQGSDLASFAGALTASANDADFRSDQP
jgi:hypothetical protein